MTHLSTTLFIPAFQLGHTNQFPSFETRRLNFQSPLQEFDSKFEIGLGNECVRFICKAEMEVMSKMGFAETTIFPTSARYPPIRLGTSAAIEEDDATVLDLVAVDVDVLGFVFDRDIAFV